MKRIRYLTIPRLIGMCFVYIRFLELLSLNDGQKVEKE